MNLSVFTYSPSDVKINISGHIISGWNKCTIEYTEPSYRIIRGIRGRNTRVKNHDSSSIITLELEQTSLSNSVLEEIEIGDRMYGTGRLTISIIDSNGNVKFQSNTGFISRAAPVVFDADATDRVWEISTLDCIASGGTSGLGDAIGSLLSGIV